MLIDVDDHVRRVCSNIVDLGDDGSCTLVMLVGDCRGLVCGIHFLYKLSLLCGVARATCSRDTTAKEKRPAFMLLTTSIPLPYKRVVFGKMLGVSATVQRS